MNALTARVHYIEGLNAFGGKMTNLPSLKKTREYDFAPVEGWEKMDGRVESTAATVGFNLTSQKNLVQAVWTCQRPTILFPFNFLYYRNPSSGLPFIVSGCLLAAELLFVQHFCSRSWLFSILLLTAAVFCGWRGLKLLIQAMSRTLGRMLRSDRPWSWDYNWPKSECVFVLSSRAIDSAFAAIILGLLFLPPTSLFIQQPASIPDPLKAVIVFFDMVWLSALCFSFHYCRRFLQEGDRHLILNKFPIDLGDQCTITWRNANRYQNTDKLFIHLRYIEQYWQRGSADEFGTSGYKQTQLFGQSVKLDPQVLRAGNDLQFSFKIPDHGQSTRLSSETKYFWSLCIETERAGKIETADFMLPVYATQNDSKFIAQR